MSRLNNPQKIIHPWREGLPTSPLWVRQKLIRIGRSIATVREDSLPPDCKLRDNIYTKSESILWDGDYVRDGNRILVAKWSHLESGVGVLNLHVFMFRFLYNSTYE